MTKKRTETSWKDRAKLEEKGQQERNMEGLGRENLAYLQSKTYLVL